MIKIKRISFDHINKAVKGEFHHAVADILSEEGVDQMLPASLMAEYRANIARYPRLDSQNASDQLTAEMQALDEARDAAYRVIRTALTAMRSSIEHDIVDYYETKIRPVFAAFWDFSTDMDYASETSNLRSLCDKLKNLDFSILARAFVTEAQIDNLMALNDRFELVYARRNFKRSKYESPSALARAMEDQWHLIATSIEAKANEPATDDNREAIASLLHVVGVLNNHIDYYRRHYIRRGVRK